MSYLYSSSLASLCRSRIARSQSRTIRRCHFWYCNAATLQCANWSNGAPPCGAFSPSSSSAVVRIGVGLDMARHGARKKKGCRIEFSSDKVA
eukprot:1194322-Prorocentrum_minimum.AAC.6